MKAAVGFRVKSGWALAVLVVCPDGSPKVLDRRVVQLADPGIPESAQPFHAALDLPKEAAAKTLRPLVKAVERFSAGSLDKLLKDYSANAAILGFGLAVGSDADPSTIRNDHIRAHAEEGRLFRSVIENAAVRHGLTAAVFSEKKILPTAVKTLKKTETQLKAILTAAGRELAGPWRSEEKAATLAAWIHLTNC